jgi:hypothetical protein
VIGERLCDAQDDRLRRIGRSRQPDSAPQPYRRRIGVIDEQPAVLGEARMERQAEQPLLVRAGADPVAQIDEGLGDQDAVAHDADHAILLDDEQTPVAGVLQINRPVQPADDGDPGGGRGVRQCQHRGGRRRRDGGCGKDRLRRRAHRRGRGRWFD